MEPDQADVDILKEELSIVKINRERYTRLNTAGRTEYREHYDLMEDVDRCLKRLESGRGSDRDRGVVEGVAGLVISEPDFAVGGEVAIARWLAAQ